MKTVIIEIIDNKVIKLLQDLELLQLIKVNWEQQSPNPTDRAAKYKGAMTKQRLTDIDNQLNELRNEWE
jgi:hypothetical protein